MESSTIMEMLDSEIFVRECETFFNYLCNPPVIPFVGSWRGDSESVINIMEKTKFCKGDDREREGYRLKLNSIVVKFGEGSVKKNHLFLSSLDFYFFLN